MKYLLILFLILVGCGDEPEKDLRAEKYGLIDSLSNALDRASSLQSATPPEKTTTHWKLTLIDSYSDIPDSLDTCEFPDIALGPFHERTPMDTTYLRIEAPGLLMVVYPGGQWQPALFGMRYKMADTAWYEDTHLWIIKDGDPRKDTALKGLWEYYR